MSKTRKVFLLPKDFSVYTPTKILLHNAVVSRDFDTLEDIFANRMVTTRTIKACADTLYSDDYTVLRSHFTSYCEVFDIDIEPLYKVLGKL